MVAPAKDTDVGRLVTVELNYNDRGSTVMKFVPAHKSTFYGHERKVMALIYEIAAELERRCDAGKLSCPISPEAYDFRIVIEGVDDLDARELRQLATGVLEDLEIRFILDPPRRRRTGR